MNESDSSHSLTVVPWQYLEIEGRNFVIKFLAMNSSYDVLISDFVSMWREKVDENELISRNSVLNPDIEVSSSRLVQQIKQMIFNYSDTTVSLKLTNVSRNTLLIVAQASLSSLLFNWEFDFVQAGDSMFADQLTLPLVIMIAELGRRQQHLIEIIKNKDQQIEDYKAEGIKLMRRYTDDDPFIEKQFMTDITLSKEFGSLVNKPWESAFSDSIKTLYTNVMKEKMDTASSATLRDHETVSKEMASCSEKCLDTSATAQHRHGPDENKDVELKRRLELKKKLADEKMKKENEKKQKKLNL